MQWSVYQLREQEGLLDIKLKFYEVMINDWYYWMPIDNGQWQRIQSVEIQS